MKTPIYMDNNATTPVDPRVLEAMVPFFTERFGNAASRTHPFGWEAEAAVDEARSEIASLINARPREIVFTSGATESDNLAIKGVVGFYRDRGDHVVTCATEHNAVLDTCRALERAGLARVTYLPVDRHGRVDPDAVRRSVTPRTILISIMFANNEIGTVHPIREIGTIAKEAGVLFHCDAAQALGKIAVDVESMGIDLLSVSAHKIYGPKGVGALAVRSRNPRVRLVAQLEGGGHERGLRSGTLNVPGIVGLGRAARICQEEMAAEGERLRALRDRLHERTARGTDEVHLNGHPVERLPGNLNLSFSYVEAESLLMALNREVALSSGAACTSARLEPSHVLRALGVGEERLQSSIRFGLGRFNTEEEVDYVAERVVDAVRRLREMSPHYRRVATGGVAKQAVMNGS